MQPFRLDRLNAILAVEHRLPVAGRHDALGLLVANSRALWPPFVDWLRDAPQRVELADPLDRYVEDALAAAVAALPVAAAVYLAHGPAGRRIAAQRIAVAAGLAVLAPSQLCIHPELGPWLGLRGVIVLDVAGPVAPTPPVADPCHGCHAPCRIAFEHALRVGGALGHRSAWREWNAVREACLVGRRYRYSDDQLRYHGTVDRTILRRLAAVAE